MLRCTRHFFVQNFLTFYIVFKNYFKNREHTLRVQKRLVRLLVQTNIFCYHPA
jgi:hypothetical protein